MLLRSASVGMHMAHALPTAPLRGMLGIARKVTSDDIVPTLTKEMPGGGKLRTVQPAPNPDAIFLPACVGSMFKTDHACGQGVEARFGNLLPLRGARSALRRACGISAAAPPGSRRGWRKAMR